MTLVPLQRAGLMLGIGLGGFFDGIVLHQLLQWHHFVSSVIPIDTLDGLQLNTLWDGLFHTAMYLVTLIGLVLLWKAIGRVGQDVPHSPRTILGSLLIGAGIFHLFDGIVNHFILGIHHIREGPNELLYDLLFLGIGIGLVWVGGWIQRRATGLKS
ncbi:MAG: DUF2243 domain-containing protein [Anaerolineae bacterium]|jgi:uncharacterized membrane protein|nr:DUF2243 domain-containing protein [Anaerolineae bacterium]